MQFSRYLSKPLMANGFMELHGDPFAVVRHDFAGKTDLQIKGCLSGARLARFDEECRSAVKPRHGGRDFSDWSRRFGFPDEPEAQRLAAEGLPYPYWADTAPAKNVTAVACRRAVLHGLGGA